MNTRHDSTSLWQRTSTLRQGSISVLCFLFSFTYGRAGLDTWCLEYPWLAREPRPLERHRLTPEGCVCTDEIAIRYPFQKRTGGVMDRLGAGFVVKYISTWVVAGLSEDLRVGGEGRHEALHTSIHPPTATIRAVRATCRRVFCVHPRTRHMESIMCIECDCCPHLWRL